MWYDNYFLLGMDQCKSTKKLNRMKNNRVFMQQFMRLMETAMRRYRIENLPDTVSERVVLQSMITYGNIVFFKHGNSILALPGVGGQGGYNVNGDPVSAYVFSKNGVFNKEVKLYIKGGQNDKLVKDGIATVHNANFDGVMVHETKTRFPFIETVIYYAQAIADTYRTIDVARTWIKQPFIPVCEESIVPSVKKMFQDMKDNDEMIIASTGVQDISKFNILPIDTATTSIDTACQLIDWYTEQFKIACGFDGNTQIDKKGENLISDEVNFNEDYTEKHSNDMLEYIQSQLDVANEYFGLNMKVVEVEGAEENQEVKKDENTESETSSRV